MRSDRTCREWVARHQRAALQRRRRQMAPPHAHVAARPLGSESIPSPCSPQTGPFPLQAAPGHTPSWRFRCRPPGLPPASQPGRGASRWCAARRRPPWGPRTARRLASQVSARLPAQSTACCPLCELWIAPGPIQRKCGPRRWPAAANLPRRHVRLPASALAPGLSVSSVGVGAWSWGDRSRYWQNELDKPSNLTVRGGGRAAEPVAGAAAAAWRLPPTER